MSDEHSTGQERWRDIPGHPGYQVSDRGGVRSRWKFGAGGLGEAWHPVKSKPSREGHRQVRLRRRDFYVHRLVLLAFVGPCPEGQECCHADDDPANNTLGNLSWGTRRKNMDDRQRNGRVARGNTHATAKVTEADALVIRRRAATGETYAAIAADYPIGGSAVMAIVRGRNFKHLPGAMPRRRAVRSVTDEGGVVPPAQN